MSRRGVLMKNHYPAAWLLAAAGLFIVLASCPATGQTVSGDAVRETIRNAIVSLLDDGRSCTTELPVFGRMMTVKVTGADSQTIETELDDDILDVPFSSIDNATLGHLLLTLGGDTLSSRNRINAGILIRLSGDANAGNRIIQNTIAADPKNADALRKMVTAVFGEETRKAPVTFVNDRTPAPKKNTASLPRLPASAWESIGPGGGGYMFYPGISPHNPKLMFIACDMSGSYRSDDGGRTWHIFSPPAGTFGMMTMYPAFHPTDPLTIFWGNAAALLVSHDAGVTWSVAHKNSKRGTLRTASLAVFDPDYPDTIFIAHGRRPAWKPHSETNEFYISRNGGKAFSQISAFPENGAVVGVVVDRFSPRNQRKFFAATTGGVFVSVNGGGAWKPAGNGLPKSMLYAFAGGTNMKTRKKKNAVFLYASFLSKGVYVSRDGGETWVKTSLPGGTDYRDIAVPRCDPAVAYVVTGNMNDAVRIYRTRDGGKSWTPVEGNGKNPDDPGWKYLQGPGASGRINSLCVSDTDPGLLLATDRSSAIVGEQSGDYWRQVYCDLKKPGLWRGRGLEVTSCVNIVFDPNDPKRVYASYNDQGLLISPDGGESWDTSMRSRLFDAGAIGFSNYAVALDPKRSGVIYVGLTLSNDLARRRKDASLTLKGDLARGDQYGKKWTILGKGKGLPPGPCTAILLIPGASAGKQRIVAGIFGSGLFVSDDGGGTFHDANQGIGTGKFVFELVRASDGKIYVAFLDGPSGDGGLYVSSNGGDAWAQLGKGVLHNVMDIEIAPGNPRVIFAACSENGGSDGVFRSDNGGTSWKRIFSHSRTAGVCVDPAARNVIYACSDDWVNGGLWRSDNGGQSWKEIDNMPFKRIRRVVVDPSGNGRVWLATNGGGILRSVPAAR